MLYVGTIGSGDWGQPFSYIPLELALLSRFVASVEWGESIPLLTRSLQFFYKYFEESGKRSGSDT